YYVLLGIPIAILCIVQYRLPATHFLNRYSNADRSLPISPASVAMVGDAVRVTGPFSYISGLSTYLSFVTASLLGLMMSARWKLKGNALTWLGLFLTVVVIPMTGARALVMYFILYVMILVAISSMLKQGKAAPSKMIIAGICFASLSIGMFGQAFDRFAE